MPEMRNKSMRRLRIRAGDTLFSVCGWVGKRTGSRENTCGIIIQKNYVATGNFLPLPMTTEVMEKE
ncbi:MAG: hypothetical protein BWY74_00766 [Firmicutes bacterium ADurb.Bin419]|nr:MAG: hypothetical protein BWY74_00766 [Firmicutes bacterium ADurb.Bin419]